jgi:hypothetical protein
MITPRTWTSDELKSDALEARSLFRRERLDEPLELYTEFFEIFTPIFAELVDELGSLAKNDAPDAIARIMRSENKKTAFRYLAAPPISEDDLKVLADSKLSASALGSDPESAKRVREIVLHILDPHRFAWAKEQREPSKHEREIAIVSSAALVAARKVETKRRNEARSVQEEAVKALLTSIGFVEVKKRKIGLLSQAPGKGEYCGESTLGSTRADLVIGLYDGRVMPVECKASNSEVNSFKRINHEALGKAQKWLSDFGKSATVPSAVISGVFNTNNLESAQHGGLNLIWSHRLEDLAEFIKATQA